MRKAGRAVSIYIVVVALFSEAFAVSKNIVKVQNTSPNQRLLTISETREEIVALTGRQSRTPYLSFPFVSQGSVSHTVQRLNPDVVVLGSPPGLLIDTAKGQPGTARASPPGSGSSGGVILKQLGVMRGEKLYSLIVYPYDYDASSGKLTYYRTIRITLSSTQPFPDNFDKPVMMSTRKLVNKVSVASTAPTGTYIRIVVNQDGIYHITGRDLDTSGVSISGFTSRNLTLWNKGKQVPIYIYTSGGIQFTSDSYLEFYGTANRVDYSNGRNDLYLDPYTDNNVYFLTDDSTASPQRLVTETPSQNQSSPPIDLSAYSFTQTIHLEQDKVFERLDTVDMNETYDSQDHWFWTEVSSNKMVTVPFYISYPDTTNIEPLTLTAAFQGITHLNPVNGSPDVPDEHQAQLFLNQIHILNTSWNGQTIRIAGVGASSNIPQNALHHGYNSFQVYDANPGSVAVSTLALNWVELKYQRLYVADKDYIRFTIPDNAQPGYYSFLIRNFKDPAVSVYRVNNSKINGVTIRNITGLGNQTQYAAQFQVYVQSTDDQFIAVSDSGKLKPLSIEQVPNAGLSSYDYSADYIMITSRTIDDLTKKNQDPTNPVNQLASWYNSHGTKTLLVDAAQVYDEFNYGIKSPYAIRSFISYAYHNWSVAPKYVLLIGAGSWNTKNGNDAFNLVPVMMMQTYDFGAAASDNFYACVDGDDPIPDVAVGRIPAKNVDQTKAAIDKILSYYSNTTFGWQNTALLIGGEESEFHTETDYIVRNVMPPSFFVKRLYTSIQDPATDTKYYGVTQDLINDFNQGVSVINYMGHGGGAIWADNGILTNDAVQSLTNKGKYPFVSSMTCFAGAFDGQIGQPLASTLLLAQDKGAIGVLASAGLGWKFNDYYMDTEILPLLFDSAYAGQSIGSDIIVGKSVYYASYSNWDQAVTMLNQYNLLGDPALKLQLPNASSSVRLNSYTTSPGQNVAGTFTNGPSGGTGVVQITDAGGYPVAQSNVTLDGTGSGTFNIQFPGGFTGQGLVKAYTHNNTVQSSASIGLSTGSTFAQVTNFGITSATEGFRVSVAAAATSAFTIDSLAFVGKIYKSVNSTADVFVANLSVPLYLSSSGGYFGSTTIGTDILKPGEVITGSLNCVCSDSTEFSTAQASYTVPGAADLAAFSRQGYTGVNSSIKVIADSIVRIEGLVYDWNSVAVQNVRVDFFDGPKSAGKFIGSARVSFDTTAQKMASTPCNLSTGNHTVYMYLVFDSLTNGFDLNPGNNFGYQSVYVGFDAADSAGVVRIDSTAWMSELPPGQIVATGHAAPSLYPQPFVVPAKEKDGTAQYFQFSPLKTSGTGNYNVSLKIYNPDSSTANNMQALRVYEYDPRTRTLNLVGGSFDGEIVTAPVTQPGIFVAAFSTDHTPPQITISAGDQFFTNGDYVPPNPEFSLLMHDEDGINLNRNDINLQLDGQRIDPSVITIPDSVSNPTSVSATVQLPVKDGSHTIEVTALDAAGNVSNPVSASFVVRSDFSLRVYGAYPDPFVDKTFIAFEITSGNPIDAVQIKIYSVSGRLVRTIRYPSTSPMEESGLLEGGTGSPTAVGYHEAWWDGTDNYGNQVANGVYFYRVTISSGGKKLDDIGKMARLR